MQFDVQAIRRQFPALNESFNGRPAVFFDNPGGTQVPQRVIDAMTDYLIRRNANTHGAFETSQRSDRVIAGARQAAANLLGAEPDEVVFGANMTSLAFHLSRSLAHAIGPGDEIVVTRLDHDANIMPWVTMAEERGATVKWVDVDLESCTLDMLHMQEQITPRTKLVAVGYASNASGTVNDVQQIVQWAKAHGATTFIDAVQFAPHGLIDVKELDCDFLACSAYKFFGPHVGILYGKREHLSRMRAYRVRPSSDLPPEKWETGTLNHEGLAGVAAAVDYLADLGAAYGEVAAGANQREQLRAAWRVLGDYEQLLIERLIVGLEVIPNVRIYGITRRADWQRRVATVSIRKEGVTPLQMASALAAENIFVWDGNFYALALCERLGVEPSGGLLRIGLAHYNTFEEIDRLLTAVDRL